MLPTTIMVDGVPRYVIRPTDKKDLDRFCRNAKKFLLGENTEGKVTNRPADEAETARWQDGAGLHKAWGNDEGFFGVPL